MTRLTKLYILYLLVRGEIRNIKKEDTLMSIHEKLSILRVHLQILINEIQVLRNRLKNGESYKLYEQIAHKNNRKISIQQEITKLQEITY